MKDLTRCIETLQAQIERHSRSGLKEYPTRTIFIDPLLEALGWDIRDPDDVELEYPTVDGKSVDYALKINRKPVLLLEAKQLSDPLEDVKAITQVVGYAANDGIEWCVLTNGVRYRVYRTSERAAAPEKLLYEVSIHPKDTQGLSVDQVASQLSRLSRDSIARGILDELGDQIFSATKVRKALDKLFSEPPAPFIRSIRKLVGDERLTPKQIEIALNRIWRPGIPDTRLVERESARHDTRRSGRGPGPVRDYPESHHTAGKPSEVVELYRALDKFCLDLAPTEVIRRHLAKYVSWAHEKHIFCCVHLQQSGLRVWLKLNPADIRDGPSFARDVSRIGHWGVGDIELAIDSMQRLREAEGLIRASFERVRQP